MDVVGDVGSRDAIETARSTPVAIVIRIARQRMHRKGSDPGRQIRVDRPTAVLIHRLDQKTKSVRLTS